jgi:pimeloyl-ACP methyl ester carboxylesterase
MVPGRPRVLWRMLSPKRYRSPDHLARIGPQLYGGVLRRQPEHLRRHVEHIRAPRGRGYLYQLLAVWGWTSLPWLPLLRQPTLVLAGRDDPIVPLVNARLLAALLRRARLHIVDDGHLLLVTSAERVAPVVQAFLSEP